MNPGNHLLDMAQRTAAGTDQDIEELGDMTTPEEMYQGVIGHRAPTTAEPTAQDSGE